MRALPPGGGGGRLLHAEGWGMLGLKKEGFYSFLKKKTEPVRFGSVFSVSSLSNRSVF